MKKKALLVVGLLLCGICMGAVTVGTCVINFGGEGGASLTYSGDPQPRFEIYGGDNHELTLKSDGIFRLKQWTREYITIGDAGETFQLHFIPTADPQKLDALWNDNGTLKISAGP